MMGNRLPIRRVKRACGLRSCTRSGGKGCVGASGIAIYMSGVRITSSLRLLSGRGVPGT